MEVTVTPRLLHLDVFGVSIHDVYLSVLVT